MKKRFLAILLSVAMVCSAGCGDAKDVEQQESSAVETYETSISAEDVSEESLGGKINSNPDTETSTTGHSTSSSEETDEPFISSSEWSQMKAEEYYDELVSLLDMTFNSDTLLMETTYMDSLNLSIKKSPEFMEMYMQSGDSIFSFAAHDTDKDNSKIYVQITLPDENGNIQTLKQMAKVSKDSESGSFADDMLSEYTIDEDTLLYDGKESYSVAKYSGETTNYCIKNLEDESMNTLDGYYMICEEKDGYIISMKVALEEGEEPIVLKLTPNNVYFSEYDDSQYEEVSEEDIAWTLFGGIMSIAMSASDDSDSFDLSFEEN